MANWELVEAMCENAEAIHWDGCHKIYLSMDMEQVDKMEGYGYDVIMPDIDTLREWWEDSCSLKFIEAVFTTPNPAKGFIQIIAQFEDMT